MAAIGLDPEALARLRGELERSRIQLESIGPATDRSLRAIGWRGTDADRFVREWRAVHRPTIDRAAQFCRRLAAELERHVDEQTKASRRGSSIADALRTAPPMPPAPRDVAMLGGRAQATIGPLLVAEGLWITVEDIGRSRQRVEVTDLQAAGLAANTGAGGHVEMGDRGVGVEGSIEASAELQAVERSVYTIDDGDLPWLIAGKLGDRAIDRAGIVGLGLRVAGGVGGWVLDRVGVDNPLGPSPTLPDADRTEQFVGGRISVWGSATFGDLKAKAAADAAVLVKIPESRSDSLRFEIRETASVWIGTALGPMVGIPLRVSGSMQATVEAMRDDHGTITQLDVEIVSLSNSDAESVRARVDMGHPDMVANADRVNAAVDRLMDGDLDGAGDQLRGIVASEESVAVRRTTGSVESMPVSIGLGGSLEGVGATGSFDGGVSEIDWDPRRS